MAIKITNKLKELLLGALCFAGIFYFLIYSETTSAVNFMNRWLIFESIGISLFISMNLHLSPIPSRYSNFKDVLISYYYRKTDLYIFKKNYLDIVVKSLLLGISIWILVFAENMEPQNAWKGYINNLSWTVWITYFFFIFCIVTSIIGLIILTSAVRKNRKNKITINKSKITWSIDASEEKTVEIDDILEYHLESNVIHLKTSKGIYEINLITLSLDLFADEILGVLKINAKNAHTHF